MLIIGFYCIWTLNFTIVYEMSYVNKFALPCHMAMLLCRIFMLLIPFVLCPRQKMYKFATTTATKEH